MGFWVGKGIFHRYGVSLLRSTLNLTHVYDYNMGL